MGGRRVKVPRDPARIVCLRPGTLRLIVYLKAQDKVVGVEAMEKRYPTGRPYWMASQDLSRLPTVGPGGVNQGLDLEAVLQVRPQVIFISYLSPAEADALQRKLKIPVVLITYGRFASFDPVVYDSLRLMGKILSKNKRAEQVISFIEGTRRDLKALTAGIPAKLKPGIYVGGIGYKGSHGLGSTDTGYIPFAWVNAKHVAAGESAPGHLFIGRESLLSLDPEVIFIDGGGTALVSQDFRQRPAFYQGLRAFRQRRVYGLFPFNWYVTNIETALADAYAVGKTIYPAHFSDLDLIVKADQIFAYLAGKPVCRKMEQIYGPLGGVPSFLK